MQKLGRLFLLVIGMTSFVTMAQNADSVIVIYKNQKTVIPVPAYKSQSSISYSDSIRVIEIGVSQRKPGDISLFPQNPLSTLLTDKPKNKAKWFSQIEAGYSFSIPNNTYPSSYRNNEHFKGYEIGISVREKERFVNNIISIVSGVDLGYIQSFRHVLSPESNDQVILYSEVFRSSFFNISFPVSFKYHFSAFDLPANIHIGANLVYGYMFISRSDNRTGLRKEYDNGLIILEPHMGIDIGKMGLNIASGRNLFPEMSFYNPVKSINSISITYRLF
jgi:hypothetical protein